MKIFYLLMTLSVCILWSADSGAQIFFNKTEPACKCADAQYAMVSDTAVTALYNSYKADEIVSDFIKLVNLNTVERTLRFSDNIYVKSASCARKNLALAVKCDGENKGTKGRFILYDERAVDAIIGNARLTRNADWFILAHEVSHHIHNHLHDVDYLVNEQRKLEKYPVAGDPCKGKDCDVIRRNHEKELEADALAVWLLKKSDMKDEEIVSMLNKISDFFPSDRATTTHPSFFVRKKMVRKILDNWDKEFKNNGSPAMKVHKFVETGYEEILFDTDEEARIYLTALETEKRNQIQHYKKSLMVLKEAETKNQAGDYGDAIELYEAAVGELELSTYFNEEERELILNQKERCQAIIAIRKFYKISPVVGFSYGRPSFKAEGKSVDAAAKPGIVYGIKIGKYHWKRSDWYELGLNYTQQSFSTLLATNNEKRMLEEFTMSHLFANLNFNLTNLGKKVPILSWKTGVVATAGPVYNYYIKNKYTNYLSGETKGVAFKPGFGGTAGLGIEKLSRKGDKAFGNFRIMLNYNFQNLQFENSEAVRTDYKLLMHQLCLSISYRQW